MNVRGRFSVLTLALLFSSSLLGFDGPRNAIEFETLMGDLHGETRSVCFIFEGEITPLGRGGQAKPGGRAISFQGLYALRPGASQAGLLEVYRTTPPDPPEHESLALFNGNLERIDGPSGSRGLDGKPRKPLTQHGAPGSLHGTPSPEWFHFAWYFSAYLFHDYPEMVFENLGWEDVDGHRCLKVKLGAVPGSKSATSQMIFWIDLTRGGHPLKTEKYSDGKLLHRVDGIELAKVRDVSGKESWFPVKAVTSVHGSPGGDSHEQPTARSTYGVVLGSIQLNRDLPDSAFVVHTKPRTELGNAVSLKREHPIEAQPRKMERPKTDPASVKARLDAGLAEADKQAEEIRASSPAREPWNAVAILQATIALIGVGAIAGAVWWKRKYS